MGGTGIGLFFPSDIDNWYMEYLTIIYLSFPLLYRITYKAKEHLFFFSMSVVMVSLISCVIIGNYNLCHAVSRMPMIICGISAYIFEKNGNFTKCFSLLSLVALMSVADFTRESYLFVPIAVFALTNAKQLPFYKLFNLLGKYSLEIFLTHIFALRLLYSTNSIVVNILLSLSCLILLPIIAIKLNRLGKN